VTRNRVGASRLWLGRGLFVCIIGISLYTYI
jgi:hypothetical protein